MPDFMELTIVQRQAVTKKKALHKSARAGKSRILNELVNSHLKLPMDGQRVCPLWASRTARRWPAGLPTWKWVAAGNAGLVQWHDSLSGQGLGEADGVTGGLEDVCVVQEPVNCRGGHRFGHLLVKAGGPCRGDHELSSEPPGRSHHRPPGTWSMMDSSMRDEELREVHRRSHPSGRLEKVK